MRRNRIDIIVDILSAASKGASRTRIMYRANLNFTTFERYFEELLGKGLIKHVGSSSDNGCPIYKTTEEAEALLKELDRVDRYIGLQVRNRNKWNSVY